MERKYYIVEAGHQSGPFSVEELRYMNVTPSTLVWCQGMTAWEQAVNIPELSDIFFNPGQQAPNPQQGQYGQYGPQNNSGYHFNWLPWAIVATIAGGLFSCIGLIFGILGIINANKANAAYAAGDVYSGDSANSTAQTMTIIGLVIAGIGLILTCSFFL